MNAPLFKQLSREEFTRLSIEEQLHYMSELMAEMRERSEETRCQLEQAKQTLAKLEKKYPAST